MAEGGEKIEAFEAIGRIEVDLEKLKTSLDKAHTLVKENAVRTEATLSDHAKKITEHIKNLPGGGSSEGGPGGEGPGGGGGEGGGRHNPTAEFAHIARVVRHDLTPALARLNPQLAEFITAGAQSARSAVFFGGAIGGIAIAGAVASTIIAKYIDKAKEMTAATHESSRALDLLDASRAEAGIKKISEAIAEYNVQSDIATGKIESGFWQKLIAYAAVATESVTGAIETQRDKLHEFLVSSAKIGWETTVPKAQIQAQKDAADLFERQAKIQVQQATGADALTNAYDMQTRAIKAKSVATIEGLQQDQKIADAQHKNLIQQLEDGKRIAESDYTKAMGKAERMAPGLREDAAATATEERNKKIMKLTVDQGLAETVYLQNKLDSDNKIKKSNDDTTQNLKENLESRAAALLKETESRASLVDRTIAAEEKIRQVHQADLGQVESEGHMTDRLRQSREAALEPLRTELTQIEQRGELRKKELQDRLREVSAGVEHTTKGTKEHDANVAAQKELGKELEELETTQSSITAKKKAEIALKELEKQGEEEAAIIARNHALVEQENKTAQHRIVMGRVSMIDEARRLQRAVADPRRSLDEQRKAEEDLQGLKVQYANNYFKLYESLGRPLYAEQLQFAKDIANEQVIGSQKWFDSVQEVAKKYQEIHDKATGIANTQAGIAEQTARRHGVEEIGPQDVARWMEVARGEANQKLQGGKGTGLGIGEALNIRQIGYKASRPGGGFGENFSEALKDPQQEFANALENLGTSVGSSSQVVKEGQEQVGESSGRAAAALRDLTDAAASAAGALRGIQGDGSGTFKGQPVTNGDTSDSFQKRLDAANSKLAGYGSNRPVLSSNGSAYQPPLPPVLSTAVGKTGADEVKRGAAIGADQ